MKLLLDTCTFLWIAEGSSELGPRASEAYLDPENERYLSAASAWEIGIKYKRGKMPLRKEPSVYIPELRHRGAVSALSIDEESAAYVATLPAIHLDPFDRLLVAQAIVHGMTILTSDEAIEQYGVKTLW